MIQLIENLPSNMVGFKATGEVTEVDFMETVMPKVKELIAKTDKLNYMLVLDTSIENFTAGAWFKDAIMGIKHLTKWNRAAIVTDVEAIRTLQAYSASSCPVNLKALSIKTCRQRSIGHRRRYNPSFSYLFA